MTGISAGQVILRRGANDNLEVVLLESVPGVGDSSRITVVDGLYQYGRAGIEQIVFDDGTIWQRDSFGTRIAEAQATPLNDLLVGSSAADTLTGGRGNDRIEGQGGDDVYVFARGDGADDIQESAGTDTLRILGYALAEATLSRRGLTGTGVEINLETGTGSAGDAAGDVVSGFETVLGSVWADTITGSAGDDRIDAGRGNDGMAGGIGSDTYVFGFGSGADTLNEGNAVGTDMILLQSPVRSVDVSLVREGDDLLIELENNGTFLTDSLRVTGHFSGAQTGIEEIAFTDGRIWTRTDIENLARVGRFNAADDLYRFGIEDEVAVIDPLFLIQNDASEGAAALELISVQGEGGASASIGADGMIRFQGAQDQNGDAFFSYTVRDAYGRESTARVEVNLSPVNDAPVTQPDGPFTGIEDQVLTISVADIFGNDSDVDGDSLTIIRLAPLLDQDGDPVGSGSRYNLTYGRGGVSDGMIQFEPLPDHIGFAGFRYLVSDGNGGEVSLEIALYATDGSTTASDVFVLTVANNAGVAYDQVINGTNAGDTLTGTDGRDRINGRNGGDTIYDRGGNDDVFANGGADTIFAGAGSDLYDGGGGIDTVDYGEATSGLTINMFSPALSTGIAQGDRFTSIEILKASAFDDVLIARSGLDQLHGQAGNDYLRDAAGAQELYGGEGSDWFQLIGNDRPTDRVMDFKLGTDVLDLSLWEATSVAQLTFRQTGSGSSIALEITYGSGKTRQTVVLEGIRSANQASLIQTLILAGNTSILSDRWAGNTIDGTASADLIDGGYLDAEREGISGGGQTILAGAGNDVIWDGIGNDIVRGEDGDDPFMIGSGDDTIEGGAGIDTASYDGAAGGVLVDMTEQTRNAGWATGDTLAGIEKLVGSAYDDVLIANGTMSHLDGGVGNDVLRDDVGLQVMTGGLGADTFSISADNQMDRITDFNAEEDKIDLASWGGTDFGSLQISEQDDAGQKSLIIRFGSERLQLDGLTMADISLLDRTDFVFAPPLPAPPPSFMSGMMSEEPAPEPSNNRIDTAALDPLAATMNLAAASFDGLVFVSPVEDTGFAISPSSSRLSSLIEGDGRYADGGQEPAAQGGTGDAPSGVLVDPEQALQAFLSPTQLAALDHDAHSFF